METRGWDVAPPGAEVQPMVEPVVVRQIRVLASRGWGAKRISRELGLARNTVRRYLRRGSAAEQQERPRRRRLDEAARREAGELFQGLAAGNAVVVAHELSRRGVLASVRTVQRTVAAQRRAARVADVATVRFETAPGQQLQVDFGQKRVAIAGQPTVIHLLVAVLSYSRRLFVRAFLRERGDDWREGLAAAFRHFGGVPRTVLGDNARALVVGRDAVAQTVIFHPAYLAFCRDWDVAPRACAPYRARTKGKGESGVKYVKHNALAGRGFASFAALEQHLGTWMVEADTRRHGTTRETPRERFERAERDALRPLPRHPLPVRTQRLQRRVAADALIDLDTVRYSVPHGLVRETLEAELGEVEVRIYRGAELVARHARSREPYARVIDPAHYAGLWRRPAREPGRTLAAESALAALGRSLHVYADAVEADAAW